MMNLDYLAIGTETLWTAGKKPFGVFQALMFVCSTSQIRNFFKKKIRKSQQV